MPRVGRSKRVPGSGSDSDSDSDSVSDIDIGPDAVSSADIDGLDPMVTNPRRSARIVRIRHLNSGPHPTAGVTISHTDLRLAGLEIGTKVYVLVETLGRVVLEKVSREVQRSRRSSREARPVMLRPAERQMLRDELLDVVIALETSALEDEQGGRRPRARSKFARIDKLRYLRNKLQ